MTKRDGCIEERMQILGFYLVYYKDKIFSYLKTDKQLCVIPSEITQE